MHIGGLYTITIRFIRVRIITVLPEMRRQLFTTVTSSDWDHGFITVWLECDITIESSGISLRRV